MRTDDGIEIFREHLAAVWMIPVADHFRSHAPKIGHAVPVVEQTRHRLQPVAADDIQHSREVRGKLLPVVLIRII